MLYFQSIRSSSSGNCLGVWTEEGGILIDCGIKTQRECRQIMEEHGRRVQGVVVTHAHGDHICYSSLKVLGQIGIAVHCREQVAEQVMQRHYGEREPGPMVKVMAEEGVEIGQMRVRAIEVPHQRGCPTFGFVIEAEGKRIVVCTDFHQYDGIIDHLRNVDFLFVEANHDLDLLEQFPNYASHFHLSNVKTARLLHEATLRGDFGPKRVMLGHLSSRRNTGQLAVETIRSHFEREGMAMKFELMVAPRHEASGVVAI